MSRWSPFATIGELPDASRHKMLEAAEFPLTIMGLAERFAVHYGDRVAWVGGDWRVAFHGDWHASALSFCALGVMSVVRSLSTSEIESGKRPRSEYLAASDRFENNPDVVDQVLALARYLVSPEEFTSIADE